MKAIEVIMDYQCKTHRAKYYFANGIITVNNSRMELQAELISEYLKNTEGTIQGAITIEMDGPYGEFYSLREIDFFEKIAGRLLRQRRIHRLHRRGHDQYAPPGV